MKSLMIPLLTSLICVSCCWKEEPDLIEIKKSYYQVQKQDGFATDSTNADSSYPLLTNAVYYERTEEETVHPDSSSCTIQINSQVRVDGGMSVDLSDTYITVEDIIIKVNNSGGLIVFHPEIKEEMAEPTEIQGWNSIPKGLEYEGRAICKAPVIAVYKDSIYMEVTVNYVVRVRDNIFVERCPADHYSNTVSGRFSDIQFLTVNVPLYLATIRFDHVINEFEQ